MKLLKKQSILIFQRLFTVFIFLSIFASFLFFNPNLRAEKKLSSEDYQLQQAQKDISNWDEKSKTDTKSESKKKKESSNPKKTVSKKNTKNGKGELTDAKSSNEAFTKKNGQNKPKLLDEDAKILPIAKKGRVSFFSILFKTVVVLLLLGFGLYYFIRFIAKKQGLEIIGRDVVEVLTMVPIAPGKHLQIVDVAGKVLLLGLSDAGINLITEITSTDDINKILLSKSKSNTTQAQSFVSLFVDKLKGKVSSLKNYEFSETPESPKKDEFQELMAKQRERLERLKND